MCYIILPNLLHFQRAIILKEIHTQVHTSTQNIYTYGKDKHSHVTKKKGKKIYGGRKTIRDYVQYRSVIRAIRARTSDSYLPILYPFPTYPPRHNMSCQLTMHIFW